MTLTYRRDLTRKLTTEELDGNFDHVIDSANHTFLQSGSGAIAEAMQSRGRRIVYITDYMSAAQRADIILTTPTVDTTAAIQAAHDALPTSGGQLVHPGGRCLVSGNLTFTKRVNFIGSGTLEDETATAPCALIKAAAATGTMLVLSAQSSIMQGIACIGVAGNSGDGIQVKANNITLRDVSSALMGGVGIRIGHSDTTNCNAWTLDHVNARSNVGDGVYIHSDDASGSINANAGTAVNLTCHSNGGRGLHIKNGQKNTFAGLHCESNTGVGVYLEGQADTNTFIGGDQEGNDAGGSSVDVQVSASSCADNVFINVGVLGTFTDSGTRTQRISPSVNTMPQTTGEILTSGPTGGSFSGSNAQYAAFYGDSNARLRVGWKVDGPSTGLVPAQILADAVTLYLASRDTASGKVRLVSGSSHGGYLLLDHQNAKVETNEALRSTSATGGVGYSAGAGGAVTQDTSRTTGVTLNKVTGSITLVSAAGSTSWQSFTVTNSTVAATDTVRVVQKSGADKNMIHVTAVAAGSFEITFATTGGTTTEQPVFSFTVMKGAAS